MVFGKVLVRCFFAAAGGALAVPAAHATTYDAVSQFTSAINKDTKKHPWTYRYSESGTRDGNYTLLPTPFTDTNPWLTDGGKQVLLSGWTNPGPAYPYITANKPDRRLHRSYCCGDVYLAGQSIFVDPGTQVTVLSFLVPKGTARNTLATVTYSFTDIDCHGGNGIDWYVDKNSGLTADLAGGPLQSTSCDPSGYATASGTLQVKVKKGDRINFIIDNAGDYSYDSSAMTATVTLP